MRSIRLLITGVFVLAYAWAQNPVQNHSFETGDLTNWTTDHNVGWGSESHISIDSATAVSGNYFLELGVGNGGGAGGYAVAFQKITAGLVPGQKVTLSAYIKDNGDTLAGGDFSALKIEMYDGSTQLVSKEVIQTGVTATWQKFSIDHIVPFGADTLVAVLVATRWDGGGMANYGFDSIEVSYESYEAPEVNSNIYKVVETFDVLDTLWAEDGEGTLTATLDNADFVQGYGAIDVEYNIPALHGWGSFVAYQNMPDEEAASFDLTVAETLSVWLKVEEAPSRPDTMFFRVQLTDWPLGATAHELYVFESATAIDSVGDWFELKAPLVQRTQDGATLPNTEGFIKAPNDWNAPTNDEILNFESIRGIELVFVVSGWDPANNLPADSGKVSFDYMTLKGNKGMDLTFFNGLALSALASETFGWGQSTLEVVQDSGYDDGLNALKWVQGNEWGNGWSGVGFNLSEPVNMTPRWFKDSLKFHMHTDASTPSIKFQFESGSDGKAFYDLTPEAAGGWNYYSLALEDFVLDGGAANFDTSAVSVLGFMANGNAEVGRTILFGSMVTGNPVIDVLASAAPQNVSATFEDYYNIVTWDDVPGEAGEIYNVYASKWPIDSLSQTTVDVVAKGVAEGTSSAYHFIFNPLEDGDVSYYYAVECTDASGNTSVFGISDPKTNTAKGVPTISLTVPTVTIDADLTEWYDSGIKPFYISPERSSWGAGKVSGGSVTDSADASATFFVAMDTAYLYVAAEVTDEAYNGWTGTPSGNLWWEHDVFELFIGLNDERGPRTTIGGDNIFKFVFNEVGYWTEFRSSFADTVGTSYAFEAFNPDYAFEAMIPLDSLKGDNDRFVPVNGYRIIMEPTIHDKDATGWDGNVAAGRDNNDNAYQTTASWSVTWLGDMDGTLDVTPPVTNVPFVYSLSNNYPNPFNPSTQIQYTLPVSGKVRLTVFNLLGEEVMTLVNDIKPAGVHTVQFNGRNLASGMYFYRLETSDFVKSKKMLLLK